MVHFAPLYSTAPHFANPLSALRRFALPEAVAAADHGNGFEYRFGVPASPAAGACPRIPTPRCGSQLELRRVRTTAGDHCGARAAREGKRAVEVVAAREREAERR